jgi:hypothetical protein
MSVHLDACWGSLRAAATLISSAYYMHVGPSQFLQCVT